MLATILDDLYLITLHNLGITLEPLDLTQNMVKLASQRDGVLDEQLLTLEHLCKLVVVLDDLQLGLRLVGLLLNLTRVRIGIGASRVLDDQRDRSVQVLADNVLVVVLQLSLSLPPGDGSQRVIDGALQVGVVRQESLLGLLQRLGELVHRIGLLDGQIGETSDTGNLQGVLATILHPRVRDYARVDIALHLELVLGAGEDFLMKECNCYLEI